jgi:4-amino-4-deoxy-L-arabinose transferase-like glycosyltransferase
MSRLAAFLLVIIAWAAIYLPGLGVQEFKGEEARRVMPAITMIDSGNWLVPHIDGEPYLRKPPLVNWVIALSFQWTGSREEWAARLPSVLSVLALALVVLATGSRWLERDRAVAAAVMILTMLAMIDKGRLAEIEALYVSLTGIAIALWLSSEITGGSRWWKWIAPFVPLGLAMLAKGPVHLLFFYAVVVAMVASRRKWRELYSLPHVIGIGLMAGIFAAWAIPYFMATSQEGAAGVWSEQMRERLGGGGFDWAAWLLNFPRAIGNALPWVLGVPWMFHRAHLRTLPNRDAELVKGLRWPVIALFLGPLLIPGMLPRYTMPMLVPLAMLLAMVWPAQRLRLVGAGATCVGLAVVIASFVAPPYLRESVRPLGREIAGATPAEETLFVADLGFFPALMYVDRRIEFISGADKAPVEARFLLVKERDFRRLQEKGWEVREIRRVRDRSGREFLVLQRGDSKEI